MNIKKITKIVFISLILVSFIFPSVSYSHGDAVSNLVSNESPETIRRFFLANPALNINKVYPGGVTLLMFAAANNPHGSVIRLLVSLGANVNARDEAGLTPLIFAVTTNESLGVTFTLLQLGADPDLSDLEGVNALMYAARDASPPIVETLLSRNPDVNKVAKNGWTPIMFAAASNSNVRVADLLLEAGAQINVTNSNGMTPLMLASKRANNPEIVELLLRYSANTMIKTNGEMAIDFARRNPRLRNSSALRNLETTTRLRRMES